MLEIPDFEIRIIIISRQRKKKQRNKKKTNKGADQNWAVVQLNRAFVLHAKNRFSQCTALMIPVKTCLRDISDIEVREQGKALIKLMSQSTQPRLIIR